MRMAFGLVAILVTLGVVILIMKEYSLPAAKTAIDTRNKMENRFGDNTAGGLARQKESITLDDANSASGKFDGLLVQEIDKTGPLAAHFGLQQGDKIIEIGDQRLRDVVGGSDMARDLLFEAKMRQWTLVVERKGKRLTLPGGAPSGRLPGAPTEDVVRVPTH